MNTPNLPLHFADSLLMSAAYPLPLANARSLMPDNVRINLVEVFPGRAVLVVSCALYRQSPFGIYTEASLALMASHEKTTPVLTLAGLIQQSRYPAYVLHMLVSSPQAQQLGAETWALPRLLADVQMTEQGNQVVCQASLDQHVVMQLAVDRPTTDRTRSMQIETYSQRQHTLLHTIMRCNASAYGRTQGGGATLTWGPHPVGQHFAQMGISSLPLMVRFYDHMQAELDAPHPCILA